MSTTQRGFSPPRLTGEDWIVAAEDIRNKRGDGYYGQSNVGDDRGEADLHLEKWLNVEDLMVVPPQGKHSC